MVRKIAVQIELYDDQTGEYRTITNTQSPAPVTTYDFKDDILVPLIIAAGYSPEQAEDLFCDVDTCENVNCDGCLYREGKNGGEG